MVIVVMISVLLIGVVAMALDTGGQAQETAVRDKNFDLALVVAEAGAHQALAKIEASGGTFSGGISGTTPQGTYTGTATKVASGYVIDVTGEISGSQYGRTRRVRVTLGPPANFPYALFSNTNIELKNNDIVGGGVWANDSVTVEQNNVLTGTVWAAQSWVRLEGGSTVDGDVWSGGFHPAEGYAISLDNGATITGSARAGVSDPSMTCPDPNFDIALGSGANIEGDATTCGGITGSGSVLGSATTGTYTGAPVPKSLPPFNFNPANYDASTYHEFWSVGEFQTWLSSNLSDLHGTFWIQDPSPSQSNQVDLTGATVTGDVTLVTNAPIFTNGITDTGTTERSFVLVSHYEPPTGSACDVNQDSSECAIHVKNNFSTDCITVVLIYADNGPVAIKNNQEMCGSVAADSILIKNNQTLNYDPRVANIVGFGDTTYEIAKWEELSA